MIALPYLCVYKVTGPDATAFLQAQLAADIAALDSGQSSFAAYCNPRGQVIVLFLVSRQDDEWRVVCRAGLAESVFRRLGMYILRSRVFFEPWTGMQVAGLEDESERAPGEESFRPAGMELGYVFRPAAEVVIEPVDDWRAMELRQGVTWLHPETSENFLPQMLGLERIGAVSFTKGCYPGQEIIARARYLGKVKRKPVWLELDGTVRVDPGSPCELLSANTPAAAVAVDQALLGPSRSLVLAVAPVEEADPVDGLLVDGVKLPARRVFPETGC